VPENANQVETPPESVAAVLADRYGLAARGLARLPIGQGTINYRADCADRAVFVKSYPPDADVPGESDAIGLSELAGGHGVPVAAVLRNRDGQVIDTSSPIAVSVWEWMPGRVVTEGLSTSQYNQAGAALGRIHATFADLPASAGPAPQVNEWRTVDLNGLAATIDRLLSVIADHTATRPPDAFDAAAERTLTERRGMIDRIPVLLADLPDLTAQVLHGDYSPVNLLFDGEQLSAVIDFRPPDPFLIAYDLGRMAFYPNTVTSERDWMTAAGTLITGYLQNNPTVAAADIHACARVALLQLLGSLYGVKQHYLKPGLFQTDLDAFWLLRHHAAAILLDHLAETDALLHELTTTSRLSAGRGETSKGST
jgi:Ser/Thr protein kinase RdoA (MazF antagonist)